VIRPLVVLALTCVIAFAAVASAPATTAPGNTLRLYVNLSDRGIQYTMYLVIAGYGQAGGLSIVHGAQRGQVAIVAVRNLGKRPHSFQLLGKTTGALLPGRSTEFIVWLLRRGVFKYQSTLDKGKAGFSGIFTVH
jgi:hypothetical protein